MYFLLFSPISGGNESGDEDMEKTTNEYHQLSLQVINYTASHRCL